MLTIAPLFNCMESRRRTGGDFLHSIPNLEADFDGDDLIGVIADAAKVTAWPDAKGNGNDVAHGTAGNQPVFDQVDPYFNGHASVNFQRANSHYLFASTGSILTALSGADKAFEIFVVARYATKPGSETSEALVALGNSAGATPLLQCFVRHTSGALRPRFSANDGGGAVEVNGLNELVDLGPQVHCYSSNGATASNYLIGATQNPLNDALANNIASGDYSAVGSMTFNRFCIGALLRSTVANHANCAIARVLVFSRQLSAVERQQVSEHLWLKYCAAPYLTIPSRLLSGITNLWEAASVPNVDGELVTSMNDSIGSKAFSFSGGGRPTMRVLPGGRKVLEFDGVGNFGTAGVAADWAFLHNGTAMSGFIVYRILAGDAAFCPLIDTLNNDPTNRNGLGVYHDGASGAHSIQFKVGATNATPVLNHDSQDYGARPGAWHVAHWTREASIPSTEEPFQIWLDNENYAAHPAGVAAAAGDPTYTLHLGKLANTATFGKFQVALIVFYNRKLGRPGDSQIVNEWCAHQMRTSHVALAAGNGLANIMNDATMHRAFVGLARSGIGEWVHTYRRATTHGASAGVACLKTSADNYRLSKERVIFDDSANFDWRGTNSLTKISTGRLLLGGKLSATDSTLLPYTSHVLISDDHAATWSAPVFLSNVGDAWASGKTMEYDEGVNSVVELGDGSLLGHFMARFSGDGGEATRIAQCRSYDGGKKWTQPEQIFFGQATGGGGDFPEIERIQEPFVIRFPDTGMLLMAIRADTPTQRVYFATSNDDGVTWGPKPMTTLDRVDGWGHPTLARDPNNADGVFCFHRIAAANLPVWRYSASRGSQGSWSATRPVSNLTSTTTIQAYNGMTHCYPAFDESGNLWLSFGLERQPDGDVFVRRWANVGE